MNCHGFGRFLLLTRRASDGYYWGGDELICQHQAGLEGQRREMEERKRRQEEEEVEMTYFNPFSSRCPMKQLLCQKL